MQGKYLESEAAHISEYPPEPDRVTQGRGWESEQLGGAESIHPRDLVGAAMFERGGHREETSRPERRSNHFD